MRRWLPLLAVLVTTACGGRQTSDVALCGSGARLRVGLVGAAEGRAQSAAQLLPDQDQFRLRELLTVASRCEVQLEPVLSSEQARLRLQSGDWDLAFLPPGLTALALEQGGSYGLVRQLGRRSNAKSQMLVRADSGFETRGDLRGRRLGVLPRGSLTGFYLPLFNLYGLRFSEVHYALSYAELRAMLTNGEVDVIAWDGSLPIDSTRFKVLHEDSHVIPLGALALSQSLLQSDHQPFLRQLDENVTQLPPSLGYASGVIPEPYALQELRAIVTAVEGWTLPKAGQPYIVHGSKGAADAGGSR